MINLLRICLLISLTMPSMKDKTESKADLTISILSLHDTEHDVYIAVSRKTDGFPDKLDMAKAIIAKPVGKNSISVTVADLPYGKYAVMVFQDMNGNKKLDKNFLGIPTEPFAFSNNYKPMFRAPRWDDCEFEYSTKSNTVIIKKLIKM